MKKILIYGFGNPGRQDDGIGARFIQKFDEWIENENLKMISTDCNYQLNIEDSAAIANYDIVIFVDASVLDEVDDFKLEVISPDDSAIEFTMHAVSPSYILDLCKKIYCKEPKSFVLHIKAYEFDFSESITANAEKNLNDAFLFLKNFITKNLLN